MSYTNEKPDLLYDACGICELPIAAGAEDDALGFYHQKCVDLYAQFTDELERAGWPEAWGGNRTDKMADAMVRAALAGGEGAEAT
jgi:hypothetical protein